MAARKFNFTIIFVISKYASKPGNNVYKHNISQIQNHFKTSQFTLLLKSVWSSTQMHVPGEKTLMIANIINFNDF